MHAAKHFLKVFLAAFLITITTMMATGNFYLRSDIPESMIPDISRIDELLISALVAGILAALNEAVIWLNKGDS